MPTGFGLIKGLDGSKVENMNQHFGIISRCAAVLLVSLALIIFTGCSKSKALHDAIQNGDLEKVKALLESHPDLVSNTNKDGWMPLEFAAEFGNKGIVELLLSKGADVNSKDTACG